MLIIYLLISFAAGITVVAGRIINSLLAEKIGTFQGTLMNYIGGLICSAIILIISKETLVFTAETFNSIPLWAYLGGLAGVAVIVLSNYITPKISSFYLTLLMFSGQLFFGIIIDYNTSHILSAGKIIGGLLVLIGLIYNLMIDRKQELKS